MSDLTDAVRKVVTEMEDGMETTEDGEERCHAADADTVTFWRNHLQAYLPEGE